MMMQALFWFLILACDRPVRSCEDQQPLTEQTYHIPDDAQSFGQNVRLVVQGNQAVLYWTDDEGEHQMVYDIHGFY